MEETQMVKRLVPLAGVIALSSLAVVGAQTPQSPPPTPTTPQTPSASSMEPKKADGKTITVTGCIAAGETPNTFKLTNVAPAGAAEATAAAKLAPSYALTADSSINLSEHVGHKVEATGMATVKKDAVSPTSNPGTPSSADLKELAKFNVKSVKMVSTTCS
jgi:hypothetical protein